MQMTEAGFAQTQAADWRTEQHRCQGAEVRLMPDEHAASRELHHQGEMVTSRLQTRLQLQLRGQIGLNRELGRLPGTPVRAAKQPVGPNAQGTQASQHRQSALLAHRAQGSLRIVGTAKTLLGDAMANQVQINRS
jgi:hypothetical protein